MPRIVVFGTGTDVGKTYFTSHLAAALASDSSSPRVSAIKPIESGVKNTPILVSEPTQPHACDRGEEDPANVSQQLTATDAALLAAASHPPFQPPAHAYSFPESTSPHLAARLNNVTIDICVAALWVASLESARLATHHNTLQCTQANSPASAGGRTWTLVETAGGALSPLAKGVTNLDFARLLEPAIWILVAPDRLGVLHDLSATLYTMRSLGRQPDSVVLSQATAPDPSTGTNASELSELGIAKIDAVLARGAPLSRDYLAKLLQLAALRVL